MNAPILALDHTQHALRTQNERLHALYQVSLELTSTLDLNQVLQRVVEMAQRLSGAAHAHIFLYDPARDVIELAASRWATDQRIIPLQPRRSGITYQVARTGEPAYIEDTAQHPAYANSPAETRPGALVCLPLRKANRILGTLNLGYWQAHTFDEEMCYFLEMMAGQATLAIETARLYANAVEQARLEQELKVARGLQNSLIPRTLPQFDGWDLATLWQPARTVSGDLYDFLAIENTTDQALFIADVSDKGMPAALFMALARSTIRASVTAGCCPADCITRANRLLCADTVNGMFITACYAQFNPTTGTLAYVNAGHNPPLFYRAETDELQMLTRTGIALGVDATRRYSQREVQLAPNDFVLFYTDGVIEATNEQLDEFGTDALSQTIYANRHASAPDLIATLQRALDTFVATQTQADDVTVMVIKRT